MGPTTVRRPCDRTRAGEERDTAPRFFVPARIRNEASFSCRRFHARGIDVVVDAVIDDAQSATQLQGRGWLVGRKQRPEQSVLELGVDEGPADSVRSEHVGIRVREAADEEVVP